MNIAAEKEELIKRFNLIQDIDLIKAIKSLLDFSGKDNAEDEIALRASIDRAIGDSQKGLVRPYNEFMSETRKRFDK